MLTVFCNGVVMQDHTPLEGPTGHMKRAVPGPFPDRGPLALQDHGNPVRFRNIWYRPLPPNSVEGGTDGELTAEATNAKRKEIAAGVRADAAKLAGTAHLLRLAESLVYEQDPATSAEVEQLATAYIAGLKALPATQLEAKKDETNPCSAPSSISRNLKIVSTDYAPKAAL